MYGSSKNFQKASLNKIDENLSGDYKYKNFSFLKDVLLEKKEKLQKKS